MTFAAVIAQGIETAFRVGSDAVKLGTYFCSVRGVGAGDYDPVTDTVSAPTRTFQNVRIIKSAAEADALPGSIVTVRDVKLIMPAVDLPSYKPSLTDYITLQGETYSIVKIKELPVDSVHIMYCRAR